MNIPSAEPAPIACSLGSGDYRERLAYIADLNAWALRSQRREGLAIELVYGPEARERVDDLVRREKACCGFLSFAVQEDSAGIRLFLGAPEDARAMLDSLFEPFEHPAEALRRLRGEDAERGIFRVDGARTLIQPSLKKSAFLKSDLAPFVNRFEGVGGGHEYILRAELYGGFARIWPYFRREKLESFTIVPTMPGPHEDPWAENSSIWKRETLEATALWNAAWFTEKTGIQLPAKFAWGEISSGADARSWDAQIYVDFVRRDGERLRKPASTR